MNFIRVYIITMSVIDVSSTIVVLMKFTNGMGIQARHNLEDLNKELGTEKMENFSSFFITMLGVLLFLFIGIYFQKNIYIIMISFVLSVVTVIFDHINFNIKDDEKWLKFAKIGRIKNRLQSLFLMFILVMMFIV